MAREHRSPSGATIKELYGNARGCAFPGCPRPLYVLQSDTSRRLNSRIAHICARSEGGPRWDSSQTEVDNRAASNLLLLCIEHAAEVDDPGQVAKYPVSMLREWKRRQLDVSDKRGGGWDLTDEEVEEVGRLSMRIGIWNSQVTLGGEGGRAPGAGGGGGGAIGPGAMGGKGGQGGRLREDGVDPGKGGDGGRVPKLGSAGGGGGGSGGRTKTTLEVRSAQTMKVHVGQGGRPGALGVHGEDGQDTFITDEDGKVLANAKGGRGGGPGHVGAEPRDATTEDVEHGLRATSMFCADCVQLRHGLVYVLGGGWEYYSVTELPCSVDVLVTVILDMSGLETDVNLNLTLAAVNVTGKVVGERRLTASVGTPRPVVLRAFPVPLRVEAEERGVYTIRLTSGAIELGSLPLEIRVGTAA